MCLLLRLRDAPELSQFSIEVRRRIFRAIPWTAQVCMLALPLISGLGVAVAIVGITRAASMGFVIALPVGVVAALVVRCIVLAFVRGGLLLALRDAELAGEPTICLRCGYDLQGAAANTCPECGRRFTSGNQ